MNKLLAPLFLLFVIASVTTQNLNAQEDFKNEVLDDEDIKEIVYSFKFDTVMIPDDDGYMKVAVIVSQELVSNDEFDLMERSKRKVLKRFGGIYTKDSDTLLIVGENKVFFDNKWYDAGCFFTEFLRFREGAINLLDGSSDTIFVHFFKSKNKVTVYFVNETRNSEKELIIELE